MQMNERVFLAIDSGTTKLKAALVAEGGQVLCLACRATQVLKPAEGYCEMDMDALYGLLCGAVAELRQACPEAFSAIAGIGISGQGDGCWPVKADGTPAGSAILWNDTRAKTVDLPQRGDITEYLKAHHASPLVLGTLPITLRWMRENQPERYASVRWALHCKDWLNFKLTGVIATDCSDRSTSVIDVFSKEYLPELFEMMGIPEAAAMQPPLHSSTDVIGRVSAQASRETGIAQGVPVIAGALDLAAVALGVGVTDAGDGCSVMGTSLCNLVLIDQCQCDHSDTAGSILCSIMPDKYIRLMGTLTGCSALDWAKSILAPDLSYQEMEQHAMRAPLGAGGIIYHPYLYGERAPFRDPDACGGFYGLTAGTTRDDLLRAVYEGLVMSLTDCLGHLPHTGGQFYLSGGGAQSSLICQLVADSLGRRVLRPSGGELGIIGIGRAVCMGLGGSAACTRDDGLTAFCPDQANHRKLLEQFGRFTALTQAMGPHWAVRAAALREPQ